MSIGRQILVIFLSFCISFFCIRNSICHIKLDKLNNSAYKKRKKGETFVEWLFYSRYRKEIPRILLVFYFFIILLHIIAILLCVFLYIIDFPSDWGRFISASLWYFDLLWMLVMCCSSLKYTMDYKNRKKHK